MWVSFLLAIGSLAAASAQTWVARWDGSRQCEGNTGRPLREDELVLIDAGVGVLGRAKALVQDCAGIALCGAPTCQVNAFLVATEDLGKVPDDFTVYRDAQLTFLDPGAGEKTMWVAVQDGSKTRCAPGSSRVTGVSRGRRPAQDARKLLRAGFGVLRACKAHFGSILCLWACDCPTDRHNVFRVTWIGDQPPLPEGFFVVKGYGPSFAQQ